MRTRHLMQLFLALCVAAVAPFAFGQSKASASGSAASAAETSAPQTTNQGTSAVKAGTKIDAELTSAIDAKTAMPGDHIEARVLKNVKQNGHVVVHKGDRLIGTVTQAQAGATGKAGSEMSVAFDRLAGENGETQLNTVLTSVLSSSNALENQQEADAGPMMEPMGMPAGGAVGGGGRASGGGMLGGVGSTAGSAVGATGGVVGSAAGSATSSVGSTVGRAGGSVTSAAGANAGAGSNMGLATPARAIHIQSNNEAQGQAGTTSTLSTRHGDLRLDSGTRMQFRVASETSASAQRN